MNVKNNRRAMETRQRIQETLLKMLEEQELDQISVSQLCKRADINRSTFYAHYNDVTDLIQEIEMEIGAELLGELLGELPQEQLMMESIMRLDYLRMILERIRNHQLFYRAYMSSSYGQRQMNWGFAQLLDGVMRPYMQRLGIGDTELEYYFAFFKEGLVAVIRRWVFRNCAESPEYLTHILANMMEHPNFRWVDQAASVDI